MKRTTLAIAIAALFTGMSGSLHAQDAQAEPDDEQSAIEQQEEAVDEQTNADDEQPAAMQGSGYPRSSADTDDEENDPNDLMSHQIRDLEGKSVVNQQDEEIGGILRIVEHKASGDLYAVISIGGVWGIGDDEVAMPLENIEMQDDQLVTNTTYGSDEIKASAEKYDKENYSQIDNNMTLDQAQKHPN
ncbi:MAG: PRC-barrel domain-containing protein [Halomonadaceae bacterium]|uniref:PRC-barrel domain-containing protein n=1 Tax=Halomonas colorata TaxID=2742615 RepID=A0ABR9FUM7_9GAMM|nr:PRC-barrel domain-containing protein [Halomonas colorata]MBE0462361.1 PRC-barrel domain-containing protein [Halomonas colorata]